MEDNNLLLDQLLEKIKTGNAVLFAGAGFSKESVNLKDEFLPLSNELSLKICELGSFNKSTNLKYSSDRYLIDNKDNKENILKLIDLLKNTFTVKRPSNLAKIICNAPWGKFYTTNYDNTIEKIQNEVIPIDTGYSLDKFEIRDKRCVHINGYIANLDINTIEKSFKLSEASYLTFEGFLNSPWCTVFKRDLERCSTLVFIGYSLYDIDIKRILINVPNLKDNTYFIVHNTCDEEEEYSFKQFGTVLKIGVEGFSERISLENFSNKDKNISEIYLERYHCDTNERKPSDLDVEKLLIFGTLDRVILETDVLSKENSYVILRSKIDLIMTVLESNNVIVTSEFGNGKSIFLLECLPILANKFKNVYLINNPHIDNITNIEKLGVLLGDEKVVYVIDDYFQYIYIFEYLAAFENKNVRFLLFSRSGRHEKLRASLSTYNFDYKEFSVDILTNSEEDNIIHLIDSVGLWGTIDYSNLPKYNFVHQKCERQISQLLFNLLESENIKNKIRYIISGLVKDDNEIKKLTVVGLFLCMQDFTVDLHLLSEFVGNIVYNPHLLEDVNFNEIFNIKNGKFTSKSSIFCQKVIKNFVDPKYMISTLLMMAEKINLFYNRDIIHNELLKSCFKFSTIERIIPEENKMHYIICYYEKLKRTVKWLINDPHFWLQYAMGYIAYGDLEKAQVYINNAYGKASQKSNYNTDSINTQQARLYILQAIVCEDFSNSFELFKKGHRLLLPLLNTRYKYRQIYLYKNYFVAKKIFVTIPKNRAIYNKLCKCMLDSLLIGNHNNGSSESYFKEESIAILKDILNDKVV